MEKAEESSSTSPRSPLDQLHGEEAEELPPMYPAGALAAFLKKKLKIDTSTAHKLAQGLQNLKPTPDAADPCLVVIYDMTEVGTRAAAVIMTPAAALQALDAAFQNFGGTIQTFMGTQAQKVTKAVFFKTFRSYQTALFQMRDDATLAWAYTPRLAAAAGGAGAPVPITSADLLFMRADSKASTGDCAEAQFFLS